MNSFEYKLEVICLLLFVVFSSFWVLSLKEDMATGDQLVPLLALEKLIPQHEVQLLNVNFGDQLHYDQLAQLQSEVEALLLEVKVSDDSEQLFKDYKETSFSYIQLASMLKTSQRLISGNDLAGFENTQLLGEFNNIRLDMFSYISTPNSAHKAELIELLNSIVIDSGQQTDWRHLQLIKLHSLFILENYELSAAYRQKLIEMPIVEAIIQERAPLDQRIRESTVKQVIGIFCTILSLIALFVVVIKRHENTLKKTADQHKEFAANLIDMLDTHTEKVQANPMQVGVAGSILNRKPK